MNRPCARLNLTEVASGLAIRSSLELYTYSSSYLETRAVKNYSRMCTFPVPSRPSCTSLSDSSSYSMKVHRRDAHGAVREVRDGERVWWNGHTNEWVYGCSAPSRSIDTISSARSTPVAFPHVTASAVGHLPSSTFASQAAEPLARGCTFRLGADVRRPTHDRRASTCLRRYRRGRRVVST